MDNSPSLFYFSSSSGGKCIMDFYNIRKATIVLNALHHPVRQSLLNKIAAAGQATVTELINALNVEQSLLSQHLAILRRAGLVIGTRAKRFTVYTINKEQVEIVYKHVFKINQIIP